MAINATAFTHTPQVTDTPRTDWSAATRFAGD